MGSLTLVNVVKVVKVCFAYVVKPFTGEVVKVCSAPGPKPSARRGFTNRRFSRVRSAGVVDFVFQKLEKLKLCRHQHLITLLLIKTPK